MKLANGYNGIKHLHTARKTDEIEKEMIEKNKK